jgi:hypothetical protein
VTRDLTAPYVLEGTGPPERSEEYVDGVNVVASLIIPVGRKPWERRTVRGSDRADFFVFLTRERPMSP